MNQIVAVAGAAVVLGGLVAAAPQPTRTPRPRPGRRQTPTATPRVTVVRGHQGPRGVPEPQGVLGSVAVEYVRKSDTVRPRSGGIVSWRRARRRIGRSRAA